MSRFEQTHPPRAGYRPPAAWALPTAANYKEKPMSGHRRRCLFVCCLVLISAFVFKGSRSIAAQAAMDPPAEAGSAQPTFTCGGEPCDAVIRGAFSFIDRRLHGLGANGRSCADCHMPTDHFQLSPANADARFRLLALRQRFDPNADDPLFRAIDADDFRANHANAHDFGNLRHNGLIRIVFPLPPTIRLIDPVTNLLSDETEVDVWRSVPSVNDVKLTGNDGQNPWFRLPNVHGGYQLDARFKDLQEQALGALRAHAQVQSTPTQQLLDDLSSFQRILFTNNRVRGLSDAISAGTIPLPDPDPSLNALEQQGKVVFERACAQCHGGPGQSTAQAPVIRYHDIQTQCPRAVDTQSPPRFAFKVCPPRLARNARTYEITLSLPIPGHAAGTTIRRASSDPGRAFQTGFVGGPPPRDDWQHFDVPGLRGISKTAPYFHNNSADTLEEVVDHYIELFKVIEINAPPGPPPPVATTDNVHFDRAPTLADRPALIAYLRKL
jgi:cytochrome c peroxidase